MYSDVQFGVGTVNPYRIQYYKDGVAVNLESSDLDSLDYRPAFLYRPSDGSYHTGSVKAGSNNYMLYFTFTFDNSSGTLSIANGEKIFIYVM